MDIIKPWSTSTLADALAASLNGRVEVAQVADGDVLSVTMREHGDLRIFLALADDQIVVSTLLWPVDEQPDAANFNAFLLKAQKLVPLSNFAITSVDGRDYYELIGELALSSPLSAIEEELRVLADNAIDAASELREEFLVG